MPDHSRSPSPAPPADEAPKKSRRGRARATKVVEEEVVVAKKTRSTKSSKRRHPRDALKTRTGIEAEIKQYRLRKSADALVKLEELQSQFGSDAVRGIIAATKGVVESAKRKTIYPRDIDAVLQTRKLLTT